MGKYRVQSLKSSLSFGDRAAKFAFGTTSLPCLISERIVAVPSCVT